MELTIFSADVDTKKSYNLLTMLSFAEGLALFLTVSTVGAFAPGANFGVRTAPVQVRSISACIRVVQSIIYGSFCLVLLMKVAHCVAFVFHSMA